MNHDLSLHFHIQADEKHLLPYWQKRLPLSFVVTLTADADDADTTMVSVAQTLIDSAQTPSQAVMDFLEELEMLHRWIAKSSRKSSFHVRLARDEAGEVDVCMPAETLAALGKLNMALQLVVVR